MQPSIHQQAVFDFVRDGVGSAVIEAVAGSGKTTTILRAMDLLPDGASVAFVAFNRSIANELQDRTPDGVECMTMNGLGHRALMRHVGGRVKLDANKNRVLALDAVPHDEQRSAIAPVCKLVSLAKAHGLVPQGVAGECLGEATHDALSALADHFDVTYEGEGPWITWALDVLRAGIFEQRVIDFDDQLYLTLLVGARPRQYDVLFVDEAQDISVIQRELLARALKRNGRLIAVGDSRQAIYGFRGADSSSLANIADRFSAVRMPLSITYRCPRAVVELAKQYAPEIECADSAPEGVVRSANRGAFEFDNDDLVLCRKNAPLLGLAYELISNGVRCEVMGRDLGKGLAALVKRMTSQKRSTVGAVLQRLREWTDTEYNKAVDDGKDARAESIEDRSACIEVLADGIENDAPIAALLSRIDSVFNARGGVTLSSVHRAKGLEADRVVILEPDLMPSPMATQAWQKEQENNLMYVAYTRAKRELVLL